MRRLGARAFAALVVLAAGCDSSGVRAPACHSDDQCMNGVCVEGMCVQRPVGRTVAVEVVPSSASLAVTTELLGITFAGTSMNLVLDNKASIVGTVTSSPTVFAMEAHVAIGIPSRIPGRADLQINTEMAANEFGFTVPEERVAMGTLASFRFVPGAMAAQRQPPVPLNRALASSLNLEFPSPMDMRLVRGQVTGLDGRPYIGETYPALVSFRGVHVSNVVIPDATGAFTLLVPPGATPVPPDDLVTLTIGPIDDNPNNVPVLIVDEVSLSALTAPATAGTPVRVYRMPDFLPAVPVTLRVMADAKGQAGVRVRLRTEIPAPDGVARYERSTVTDSHGEATVPLIPGTADAPRSYLVSIEAPADGSFPYASLCVGDVPIVLDAAGGISDPPPFTLVRKLELSGSVSDITAAPIPDALVTATEVGGATACVDSTTPNTVSVTTDSNGNYLLLVPAGTYRLAVKPAATSARPRLAQTDPVTVSHATVFPIKLPVGEVVEGTVFASDQATLLPNASLTIFQVFCQSLPCPVGVAPPLVLGETQTDSSGNFRAVLPAP